MTTVAYFIIALWLVMLTCGLAFVAARLGEHEDLMLDLRYLVSDLRETLEKRHSTSPLVRLAGDPTWKHPLGFIADEDPKGRDAAESSEVRK